MLAPLAAFFWCHQVFIQEGTERIAIGDVEIAEAHDRNIEIHDIDIGAEDFFPGAAIDGGLEDFDGR